MRRKFKGLTCTVVQAETGSIGVQEDILTHKIQNKGTDSQNIKFHGIPRFQQKTPQKTPQTNEKCIYDLGKTIFNLNYIIMIMNERDYKISVIVIVRV